MPTASPMAPVYSSKILKTTLTTPRASNQDPAASTVSLISSTCSHQHLQPARTQPLFRPLFFLMQLNMTATESVQTSRFSCSYVHSNSFGWGPAASPNVSHVCAIAPTALNWSARTQSTRSLTLSLLLHMLCDHLLNRITSVRTAPSTPSLPPTQPLLSCFPRETTA